VQEQKSRESVSIQRLSVAEDSLARLQNELFETKQNLKTSRENTKRAEEREIALNEQLTDADDSIQRLTTKLLETKVCLKSLQESMKKAEEKESQLNEELNLADDSIASLNELLLEAKETLTSTQEQTAKLEKKLASTDVQLQEAKNSVSDLEHAVEKELEASEQMAASLEESQAQYAELKEQLESREESLSQALKSEKENGNKLKQEITEVRNELDQLQVSLSSSQHREKMLKHEVTKLEDKKRECEEELSNLKSNLDDTVQQSSKSLESVREKMSAKAQKDLEELRKRMNQLVEDERKERCRQDVVYKEQINKLNQQYNRELLRLKEGNSSELKKCTAKKDEEIEQLRKESEENIREVEKLAAEERDKLMEKGKKMMKDIKDKKDKEIKDLTDDIQFLEKKIFGEEEEKQHLGQQFQNKIIEYKKKLQVASGRINTLSTDCDEFEDRIKLLEREKFKLREENDRYRRRLGGRSGSDTALQSQVETLQNEFKNAIDENRELKRKLQGHDMQSLHSVGEDSISTPYSRTRGNQSTLLQLRAEYDETIESLNDEKRELIMKNSAAITDVQKAEKRAWMTEQDNAILKQDVTSLKLANQRLENMLADFQQDHSISAQTSLTQHNMTFSEDNSVISKPPTPEVGIQSRDSGVPGSTKGYNGNTSYSLTSPDYDKRRSTEHASYHSPYRMWK